MTWTVATRPPPLPDDEVHVWRIELTVEHRDVIASLATVLSDEERCRAERQATQTLYERFVIRRAILRRLLGDYLGQPPAEICLLNDSFGKPRLSGASAISDCRFSLSSAGTICLIAVACGREVGVDVEPVRDLPRFADLVRSTFSATEQQQFAALPPKLRQLAFFHAWTQKEAYLKAMGCGLFHGAEHVEVTVDPRMPPRLLAVAHNATEAAQWNVLDVSLNLETPATLIAENSHWICRRLRYDQSPMPARRPNPRNPETRSAFGTGAVNR